MSLLSPSETHAYNEVSGVRSTRRSTLGDFADLSAVKEHSEKFVRMFANDSWEEASAALHAVVVLLVLTFHCACRYLFLLGILMSQFTLTGRILLGAAMPLLSLDQGSDVFNLTGRTLTSLDWHLNRS